MSTQSKTVAMGWKRRARLWGASTAWSLGGWILLLGGAVLWFKLR